MEIITYNLESIPKIVIIGNRKYGLSGLVSYRPFDGETNDGHYIAFIHDGLNWQKYDDFEIKKTYVSYRDKIRPHVLMYVTCD